MTTRAVPANGILMVRKDPLPEKVGEIVLPKQLQSRPQTGTVLASDTPAYPEGCQIVFAPHAGVVAMIDGEALILLAPSEVLAVVAHE